MPSGPPTSIPPPGAPVSAHPPPPLLPEVPDGVTPSSGLPRWKPWSSIVALVAAFGATLAGAIFIGIVAAIAGADFDDPPPAVSISATVVQDACLIGSAVLFARMAGRVTPGQFGLRRSRFWPSTGWIVLVYMVFIGFSAAWVALLNIKSEENLPEELGVDDSTVALVAVAILVTVVAPVAEEFFFRGFFFTALRNWKGLWPAAILTGITFGAIHAGSSPVGYLVPLAALGVLLCLLYARTGSLYPCIALHCINNSIAFGVSQDWGWEIVVLLASSLAAITLLLWAVHRRFGREDAPAAA